MAITKGISTQVKNRKQMKKQTAVGWLEQEFIVLQNYSVNELGLFVKAKEMEKQQTMDFAAEYFYGTKRVGARLKEDFIKLYEQTYGGGEQ